MYRALLEAQEIFGLDFDDPNEFARVAEEGLGSEEEEEEEEDEVSSEAPSTVVGILYVVTPLFACWRYSDCHIRQCSQTTVASVGHFRPFSSFLCTYA